MKEKNQKVNLVAVRAFDGLLRDFIGRHTSGKTEANIFPIPGSSKSGVIIYHDGKAEQAFTIDADGKKRVATLKG